MNQEVRIKKQGKIKSFTDLLVWQNGHQFVLTMQLRRASVSFTSNIAEGFSRSTYKEKSRFYSMALGSLTEVQNQLLIVRDIGFIPKEQFQELASKTITLSKMINGLIKKSRTFIRNS